MVINLENRKYRIKLKNIFRHMHTVTKHRFIVFMLSCKAGIPWRGFIHDLSKYSPTEFWPSVKYYHDGNKSPLLVQREEEGISTAWLHHKGRNKHHIEYWYDAYAKEKAPVIPYKYFCEMICDKLSASITYEGKNWKNDSELKYWREKERERDEYNEKTRKALDEVFVQVSENGINKTITKKNLGKIYNKYCK